MIFKKTSFFLTCIAISFFNNALIANQNSDGQVAQSARPVSTASLKAGAYNMTFKSRIDGSLQPLTLKVPEGYVTDKKWPLLVTLHGLGDGPMTVSEIESMVQVGPYGRGDTKYKGLGEKDVFECIDFAKKILSVDPNRIYLCGFSMGAQGTFRLGLKHPDMWAACVPVCGALESDDLYLIENGNNIPFWINSGSDDEVVSARSLEYIYRTATGLGYNHWKYTENKDMEHSFEIDWSNVEKWLLSQTKKTKPSRVVINSYEPGKSYWFEIISQKEERRYSKVEAEIVGQTIKLSTYNISDYQIFCNSAPIISTQDVVIIENGETVFKGKLAAGGIFKKSNDNETN